MPRLLGSVLFVCVAVAAVGSTSAIAGESPGSTPVNAKTGRLLVISGLDGRTLETYTGGQKGDEFGSSVGFDTMPMTDVASNTWAVGAAGADAGSGRLFALDADTGSRLWFISGADLAGGPVERFGRSLVDLGHINDDTPVHWAVGAPGSGDENGAPGAVVIVHAPDGELVERLRVEGSPTSRLGWVVVRSDDQPRGDSIVDHFIAGAPGEKKGKKARAGAIHRFSSLDGSRQWTLRGKRKNRHLGYSLAFEPDRDDDGIEDLIVGAPGGGRTKGSVLIVSGDTGRVLHRIKAPSGAGLFGFSLTGLDLDGDGVRDLIVGAPATEGAAGEEAGAVYAFSGVDRSLIWSREGERSGQWFGSAIEASEDVDGDGLAELFVASLLRNDKKPRKDLIGGLDLISPATGDVIFQVRGKRSNDQLGWPTLQRVIDTDGDGLLDILLGSPRVGEIFIPE